MDTELSKAIDRVLEVEGRTAETMQIVFAAIEEIIKAFEKVQEVSDED